MVLGLDTDARTLGKGKYVDKLTDRYKGGSM